MFKYTITPVLSIFIGHLGYSASLEELDYSKEKKEILGYFTPSKKDSLSIQDFIKEIPFKQNVKFAINLQDQTDLGESSIDFLRDKIKERNLKIYSLNLTGIPHLSLITLESFFEKDMKKGKKHLVNYLIKMDLDKPLSVLKNAVLGHHLIFLKEDDLKKEKLNQNRRIYSLESSFKKDIIKTHKRYYKSLKKFVEKGKS